MVTALVPNCGYGTSRLLTATVLLFAVPLAFGSSPAYGLATVCE